MARVRGHDVERAVGADAFGLDHVERDRPPARARDDRLLPEIFLREHGQVVERARHDGGDDDAPDVGLGDSLRAPSNWCSHTAYSSAVRRGSVAIRQRVRISPPSATSAKTTLVFPASIASSMARP